MLDFMLILVQNSILSGMPCTLIQMTKAYGYIIVGS